MKRLGVLVGLCALAGCVSGQTAPALETALTAGEKLATVYVQKPLCTATVTTNCSVPEVSAAIKSADNVAYAAVKQAEAGTGSTAAALAALNALTAAVPSK